MQQRVLRAPPSRIPFGSPSGVRPSRPPGGSVVSRVMPAICIATELTIAICPPRRLMTGCSRVLPSRSSAVGTRFSSSWS
jgi:hypothetical protein